MASGEQGLDQAWTQAVSGARLFARLDRKVTPYLLVAPFFVLFRTFWLYPLAHTAWLSPHDWDLLGGLSAFVGCANYAALLTEHDLYHALGNTASIFVAATAPQLLARRIVGGAYGGAVNG